VTRTRRSTPERLECDFCRVAQSKGEWPGLSTTFCLGFGVLTWDDCGTPRPPTVGGPRFGRGPFGARRVAAAEGGVRRACGSLGGGMSCEGVGAPFKGLRVGGFRNAEGALAL
jgi:hypothetical protein